MLSISWDVSTVYAYVCAVTIAGNLIADVACTATKADCAIINSGTLRSDTIHDAGVFKLKVSNTHHIIFCGLRHTYIHTYVCMAV